MNKNLYLIAVFALAGMFFGFWFGMKESKLEEEMIPPVGWVKMDLETNASFRGISVVDEHTVWVSGSQGTVLRSVDAGKNWDVYQVPGAEELDFRDIQAFSAETACIISAGLPAKIYKTTDGGKSWVEQYNNQTEGVFFDSFDFWDEKHGIAMSDPLGKHSYLIHTEDGETWKELIPESLPEVKEGEAGFAASGTCLVTFGEDKAWFCTGGMAARVFRSDDRGKTWAAAATPLISGKASTGNFGMGFRDASYGVIVGGDYKDEPANIDNAAYTEDGGATWTLVEDEKPGGFREAVCFIPGTENSYITVGPSGSDYSHNGGRKWTPFGKTQGLHTLDVSPDGKAVWAAGKDGLVVKLKWKEETE